MEGFCSGDHVVLLRNYLPILDICRSYYIVFLSLQKSFIVKFAAPLSDVAKSVGVCQTV